MSNEQNQPQGEAAATGGKPEENNTSGFAAADAEPQLTVEDILDTEQTAQAKAHDRVDAADADTDGAESAESAESADNVGSAERVDGAESAESAESADTDASAAAAEQASPYLEDLRRLTAEYANYRKRTEENAELEQQRATARVITPLLAVLDDFARAEAHGDLPESSAVAQVVQKLRDTLARLGLESFGEKGEQFDPQIHEAIAHVPVPGGEANTVLDVVELGYRLGAVELRPAKVAVVAADG